MNFAAALAVGFGNQSCPCALLNACLAYESVKITDFLYESIKITFFIIQLIEFFVRKIKNKNEGI